MDILTNVNFWQNIAIIATLILTMGEFIRSRKESERSSYQDLHAAYLSFLQFSREHPELGLTEFDENDLQQFRSIGGNDALLEACNLLVALWEHAFLIRSSMPRERWAGWESWIRRYLKRSEKVRKAVRISIDEYDPHFVQYIRDMLREIEPSSQSGKPSTLEHSDPL